MSGYYDITSSNRPTTRYYYDGQMPLGDDFTRKGSNNHDLIDQNWVGIGARGMDYQSSRTWDATSSSWVTSLAESFPLYDCHGNNCLSLSRSGASGYSLSSERTYDAWGAVTGGNSPNQGYCANLGHRADDESSLVYMRARYYEPSTGRFVTEDSAMDGVNWYAYAENSPTCRVDVSGKSASFNVFAILANILIAGGFMLLGGISLTASKQERLKEWVYWLAERAAENIALNKLIGEQNTELVLGAAGWAKQIVDMYQDIKRFADLTKASPFQGVQALLGYSLILQGQMMLTDLEQCGVETGSWWGYDIGTNL